MRALTVCLVLSCASVADAAAPPAWESDLPLGARLRLGTPLWQLPFGQAPSEPLVVSADRKLVATSGGTPVEIRDARTGRRLLHFGDDESTHFSLAFSHDGKTLAVAAFRLRQPRLELWPLTKGARPAYLRVPSGFASDHRAPIATFLPGNKRLAAFDGLHLLVWDVETSKVIRSDRVRAAERNASFSPDGRLFAAQVGDTLTLTELVSGRWRRIALPPSDDEELSANWVWSADGRLLALSTSGKEVQLLDTRTARLVRRLKEDEALTPRAFSLDGRTLAVECKHGLGLYDSKTGARAQLLHASGGEYYFLTDRLLLVRSGARVCSWDVRKDEEVVRGDGHRARLHELAFSGDGRTLVSLGADDRLIRWDVRSGRMLGALAVPEDGGMAWRALSLSADGRVGLLTREGAQQVQPIADVSLLDLRKGRSAWRLDEWPLPRPVQGGIGITYGQASASGVVSSDGAMVALPMMTEEKHVVEVRRSSGSRWRVFPGSLTVRAAFAAGSCELALTGEQNGRPVVLVCDWLTGKQRLTLRAGVREERYLEAMTLSADGSVVAAVDGRSLLLWERASGHMLDRMALPADFSLTQLVLTRGGRVLALGMVAAGVNASTDRRHAVWDAAARKVVVAVDVGPRHTDRAALCGEGRTLAVGCEDASILLYDVPQPVLRKSSSLDDAARDRLWADLSGHASRAWQARQRLARAPKDAVPLLRARLKPSTTKTVKEVADLDDEDFDVRETATAKLAVALKRGDRAADLALREAATTGSLEVRRRAVRLLEQAEPVPFTREDLRLIRAVGVLEQIANGDAKALLKRLSEGGPSLLTAEARAALARLPK